MKHYGDITKINGYEVPIVDVITGGSPCQDLSVAGKRAGLAGQRSGLFMEQMRIVKEMRERDVRDGRPAQYVRPRYMVWENVPGAFSSGNPKGSDFQAVLEEIVRVVCEEVPPVPIPKEGWPKAGCISGVGDSGCTFSIAWRVHDAQFWGVPQRRKRIALVADFGGLSAPEILFERKGLSGDSEQSGAQGKETSRAVGGGVANTGGAMNPWDSQSARVYPDNGVWHSLNANENGGQSRDSVFCLQGNGIDRADTAGCNGRGWCEDVSYTLNTIDRPAVMAFAQNQVGEVRVSPMSGTLNTNSNASGRNSPLVYENHSQDSRYKPLGEISETVNAKYGTGGNNQPLVVSDVLPFDTTQVTSDKNWSNPHYGDPCHPLAAGMHPPAVAIGNGQLHQISMAEQANTLDTMHDQQAVMVPDVAHSLKAKANCDFREDSETYPVQRNIVRRLTPLECERLQGYPGGWTDIGEWTDSKGKKHKDADSPRYKALGNSIALPFWQYLARRICAQYERNITMASLFDGIGGFPLVFERCGAKAVWASEIEEFPIAVTKRHFPEDET